MNYLLYLMFRCDLNVMESEHSLYALDNVHIELEASALLVCEPKLRDSLAERH